MPDTSLTYQDFSDSISRGNDVTRNISAYTRTAPGVTSNPLDFTSGTVHVAFKLAPDDAVSLAVLNLSSPSGGISVTDAVNGLATVTLTAAQTTAFAAGTLFVECYLVDGSSKTHTFGTGRMAVK